MNPTQTRWTHPPGGRIEPGATRPIQGTAKLTLHTFATTVASNVALGGVSIVIARSLGPSEKGSYDLILATAALLATFLGLSLPTGVTYVVARGDAAVRPIIGRVSGLVVVQAILAVGLLVGIRNSPVAFAFIPPGLGDFVMWATIVLVGLTLLQSTFRAVVVGRRKIVLANRLDLFGRLSQLILFAAAWGTLWRLGREPRVFHFVWLAVASVAITCVLYFRAAYAEAGTTPSDEKAIGKVWRYALTCHAGNIAQFLNYRVAVFLVGYFLGTTAVGHYTLAMTLSQLHWLVAQAAATVLLPVVAARSGAGENSAVHVAAVSRMVVAITCVTALATAIISGTLVPWVFGAEFEGSLLPLYLLLPGVVAFVPSIVLASYFGGHGRPSVHLKGSATGLVTMLVLSVWLVPRFGTAGAAVATSAAYLLGSAVLLVAFTRSTRLSARDVVVPQVCDGTAIVRALIDRVGAGSRVSGG